MADEIGKLLKNEDSSSQIKPAASQKKLRESKKRLNGICRSLLIDTEAYEPKRTANSVDAYMSSRAVCTMNEGCLSSDGM